MSQSVNDITASSPRVSRAGRGALGPVRSAGSDKCLRSHIHHCGVMKRSFLKSALTLPCALPAYLRPSPPRQPLVLLSLSLCPSLPCQSGEPLVAFSGWCLSLSDRDFWWLPGFGGSDLTRFQPGLESASRLFSGKVQAWCWAGAWARSQRWDCVVWMTRLGVHG